MGNNSNLFKYVFAIVVAFIAIYTTYIIISNKTNVVEESLDQTSTLSNIQTELRFAIAELDIFNPLLSNNKNVHEITKIIYEPLVTLNEKYKPEYVLAKEIAKVDDTTYIVKLRNDVKWSDGTEFNVDDVIFTIDCIKKGGFYTIYQHNLANVTSIEEIDKHTVKFVLSEEVPFFEYYLTFPILSVRNFQGEDFATSQKIPIGTGLFKVSEASSNVIKLVQNEYYWDKDKKPMATLIDINLYSSMGDVYTAFKNGELDLLTVRIDDVEKYIGTLGYKKIEFKARQFDFLALNPEKGFTRNKEIRKVLSLVIDKNYIATSVVGTGFASSNFPLDYGCWLYTKDLNIGTNTEEATNILNINGWELIGNVWQKKIDGRTEKLRIKLGVDSTNQRRVNVVENIKNQLETFGIQVDIDYYSYDGYANSINNRDFEMILTGIETSYTPNLNTFFGDNNVSNYYNEEVSNIMKIIKNTNDENKLYESYQRLYDIYLEDVPYIGLYRNTDIIVYNQNLVGNITPNSFNIYHNIEKWYRQ